MMGRLVMFLMISVLACVNGYGQGSASADVPLDTGSIQAQYDYIMKKSSTYQGFKVVKISRFEKFKSNVEDSLNVAYDKRDASKGELKTQKAQILNLTSEVSSLKSNLLQTEKERDSLSFLGMLMSKGAYKGMMWGLVAILSFFAVFAYLLFKRSNVVTKNTKKELDELKEEFETHRKRALKREQELAVKYHSEINKLKNGVQ